MPRRLNVDAPKVQEPTVSKALTVATTSEWLAEPVSRSPAASGSLSHKGARLWFVCFDGGLYSERRAVAGSSRLARRAGR